MGSPVSPVIANIYTEYFEELVLVPECPIPPPCWKRYVDDVIVLKEQVDASFNHLNSVDPHIRFTVEASGNDGSIPFLDTTCSPNSDHTIQTSV